MDDGYRSTHDKIGPGELKVLQYVLSDFSEMMTTSKVRKTMTLCRSCDLEMEGLLYLLALFVTKESSCTNWR